MSRSHNIAKCGSTILSSAGRFIQIWKSSSGIVGVVVEQREHLGVDDAAAGGEPLRVAAPEASRRAERVGVVDDPAAHVGHGLEPAVRVLREAGHDLAVVHAVAVPAGEVGAELTVVEPGRRTEALVAGRVGVEVVDAEEERVDRRPRRASRAARSGGRDRSWIHARARSFTNATRSEGDVAFDTEPFCDDLRARTASSASGTSLKFPSPSGMPMIVMHSTTPAMTWPIASQQPGEHDPEHVHDHVEPAGLRDASPPPDRTATVRRRRA